MPKNVAVNSPHDPELHGLTVAEMVELWQSARSRTYMASPPCTDDYWTDLAVAARLADEITAGRWQVVRRLLCCGAVTSWAQVGQAIGMTGAQARAGFTDWITGQLSLCRWIGTIGITDAEAEELHMLVMSVPQ